ncbi:hypothetical protein FFI89_018775 [Bradyrhizobium sp. KBS0727]|uniref:hypothetical protein n=1 Tax=unclassified Bradyrhizobium TaxID=2631580 RepID=UPI00110DA2A4|nr:MULTISPECIES: hypothetical protein [unclassified Bradyrhizobium]QDW39010.1 hypothetical protein FFI71_018775 [Bradyrhizobium sp. KBS0725]QDW45613.1 hypothetical protein FFI89_018775 [Bradyrhizobium sp. KBS0727]
MSQIDYDADLIDPHYEIDGLPAQFLSREGVRADLTVLDKTAGVEIPQGPVMLQTSRPAACVRVRELIENSLDRGKMKDGRLTFNGASWNVESTLPKPVPGGQGELYLILQERSDD